MGNAIALVVCEPELQRIVKRRFQYWTIIFPLMKSNNWQWSPAVHAFCTLRLQIFVRQKIVCKRLLTKQERSNNSCCYKVRARRSFPVKIMYVSMYGTHTFIETKWLTIYCRRVYLYSFTISSRKGMETRRLQSLGGPFVHLWSHAASLSACFDYNKKTLLMPLRSFTTQSKFVVKSTFFARRTRPPICQMCNSPSLLNWAIPC